MDDRTRTRFLTKVDQNGPPPAIDPDLGRCWLWRPNSGPGGYGFFGMSGKQKLAHRASYELFVKPIPCGLTTDHLCNVRNCVRPAHLDPCTLAENLRRARERNGYHGPGKFQRGKTHCINDHPYSGDNLYIRPNGKRGCRISEAADSARWREQNPLPPKIREPDEACVNGHLWADNALWRKGIRVCIECDRAKVRRHRARKRGEAPPLGPKPPREKCKHGHDWTPENVYVNPNTGLEFCKPCHREGGQEANRRRKAAKPTSVAPVQMALM